MTSRFPAFALFAALCLAMLGSGCAKKAPIPQVYVNLDQVVASRSESQIVASFDERANRLRASSQPLPNLPAESVLLPAHEYPAESQESLNLRREVTRQTLETRRADRRARWLKLAQDRIQARRPALRAQYQPQIEALRREQQAALDALRISILEHYGDLRFSLQMDRHNLLLRQESALAPRDATQQIAVIDQKLAEYNRLMEQEAEAARQQTLGVYQAGLARIDREIDQQLAADYQQAIERIDRRMASSDTDLDLTISQNPLDNQQIVPQKQIELSAFAPQPIFPGVVSRAAADLQAGKGEWLNSLKAQTRQAVEAWCKRKGYQLVERKTSGVIDRTNDFIKEWNF